MTNSTCPKCGKPVLLTAFQNVRSGRWVVLPLEEAFGNEIEANFGVLPDETHEATTIKGETVGPYPVSEHGRMSPYNTYRTHNPSHFLEPEGHAHES